MNEQRKPITWKLDGYGNRLGTKVPMDWDLVRDGDSLDIYGNHLDITSLDRPICFKNVTIREAPSELVYGPQQLITTRTPLSTTKGKTMEDATGPFGTFTVTPTLARFTGEHGLTQAIAWAEKIQKHLPAGRVRITNEFGIDLGSSGEVGIEDVILAINAEEP